MKSFAAAIATSLALLAGSALASGTSGLTTQQIRTAVPGALNLGGVSAAEGVALGVARSDHTHSITGTLPQGNGGTGAGALTCTNQFLTSNGSAYSCSTDTLASAQHANQGSTTTVLHGNGAGNPSWAAVDLVNDITGVLLQGHGGTGTTAITCTADQAATSNGTVYSCKNVVNLQATTPTTAQAGGAWVTGTDASGSIASGFAALPTLLGRVHLLNDTGGSILGTINLDSYSGGAVAPSNHGFSARTARGTLALPTAVATDDVLASWSAYGYQSGGAFSTGPRAVIQMHAYENWTAANQGAQIRFLGTQSQTTTLKSLVKIGTDARELGRFNPFVHIAIGGVAPIYLSTGDYISLQAGDSTVFGGELWLGRSTNGLSSRILWKSGTGTGANLFTGAKWSLGFRGDSTDNLILFDEGAGTPAAFVTFVSGTGSTFADSVTVTKDTKASRAVMLSKRSTVADAAYAALSTDFEIAYTSLTTARTVTLPTAAAGNTGQIYIIKDESGSSTPTKTITAAPSSGTIDGAASVVAVKSAYGSRTVMSNGSAWFTVGHDAVDFNSTEVSVNLGTGGGLIYTTTVTGQTWVTASSRITCTPAATTSDGQTVETYYVAGFVPTTSNRVAGTGFDLAVYNPNGATGTFRFSCSGA